MRDCLPQLGRQRNQSLAVFDRLYDGQLCPVRTRVELANHVTIRVVIIHQALCRMQMPEYGTPVRDCIRVVVSGFSEEGRKLPSFSAEKHDGAGRVTLALAFFCHQGQASGVPYMSRSAS